MIYHFANLSICDLVAMCSDCIHYSVGGEGFKELLEFWNGFEVTEISEKGGCCFSHDSH